jgi:NAD(P)H-flavin reductase
MTKRLKHQVIEQVAKATTSIILCGPYGRSPLKNRGKSNILTIAGGTGISLTLPVILEAASSSRFSKVAIDFVWIIRRLSNIKWMREELEDLKRAAYEPVDLQIHIFVTREIPSVDADNPISSSSEKHMAELPLGRTSGEESSVKGPLSDKTRTVINYHIHFKRPLLRDIVGHFM